MSGQIWWGADPDIHAEEAQVAAKLRRSSHFFRFLWEIRDELFDERFQDELADAYAPRGQNPCPPALLAMVNLLQSYTGVSDAGAVDAAENDRRWQLVLGTLRWDKAPFGQGSLVRFRVRMMAHDLDRRLVERTVELAKKTKKFGWKKLRVMLDSSPLEGAGRVEDTWNLIGRAMNKLVGALSMVLDIEPARIIKEAGLTVLQSSSIKSALDIDWTDSEEQADALQILLGEVEALEHWVRSNAGVVAAEEPVQSALDVLRKVVDQDTEPDPDGCGRRIREGVAEDRLISVGDTEMRHGRKSKSKRFNGYKRHIAIANGLIVATAVVPANRREHEPTTQLLETIQQYGQIEALYIDRGYLPAAGVLEMHERGVEIHSRAWRVGRKGLFTKEDFAFNLDAKTVTCPAGEMASIMPSRLVLFAEDTCATCALKSRCTDGKRRGIRLHSHEELLIQLRARQKTRQGREELRRRVKVEHTLAQVGRLQGKRARYKGVRKNEFDLNRSAAVVNLRAGLGTAKMRAAA